MNKSVDVSLPTVDIKAGTDEIYHITGIDYGTLYLEGRTLHLDNITMSGVATGSNSVGLTFVKDAKAVVVQPINGTIEKTAYNTVAEAVSVLGDEYPNTDGKQYDGSIAAVLNSQGVAEWIVFISDVDAGSNQGGSTGPDYGVDGQELGMYSTVAEVNAALKNGNVVINGNWQPTDASSNKTVTIPANTTLKIDGNFDANGQGLIINATNATSKLVVTGQYDATLGKVINYAVNAKDMTIRTGMTAAGTKTTVLVSADVTVNNNLVVNGEGIVDIKAGTTVDVKNLVSGDTNTKTINVNGTLIVNGNVQTNSGTTGTININVLSSHSLHVAGTVYYAIVDVGDSSTQGKAVINTMGTGSTLNVVNGPAEVAVAGGSTIAIGSKGALTVTKELKTAPSSYQSQAGGTITLSTGATVTGDAADKFKDANGNSIANENLGGNSFTMGSNGTVTTDEVMAIDYLAKAAAYNYSPEYKYNGTISVSGNAVTFTYKADPERTNFMNDVVRFLGAMYRYDNGATVKSIIYNGNTYQWDSTGTLKGSNWTLNGDKYVSDLPNRNSLAYYIFGTETPGDGNLAAQNPSSITLMVDGQPIVFQRTVSSTAAN